MCSRLDAPCICVVLFCIIRSRIKIKRQTNPFPFILAINMSSNKERVFVIGATGRIGCDVVRGLIKKGVDMTAYVRNEQKARDLFKDELSMDHLTIIIGTYSSVDIYTEAIQGHTRLFLLVADLFDKPTSMSQIKGTFTCYASSWSIDDYSFFH